SNGWVSQRLALLKLHTDIQALVRTKVIPLEVARDLVKLPADEQLDAWEARKAEAENFTAVKNEAADFDVEADPSVDGDAKNAETAPRAPRQRTLDPAKVFRRL